MEFNSGDLLIYKILKLFIGISQSAEDSIAGTPWYVANQVLHNDLEVPTVKLEISKLRQKYLHKLENHQIT